MTNDEDDGDGYIVYKYNRCEINYTITCKVYYTEIFRLTSGTCWLKEELFHEI